jgi:hypothetical protein
VLLRLREAEGRQRLITLTRVSGARAQGELAELSVAHHSALAEYPYVRGFPLCVGLDETSEEDLAEIVLRTRLADDHAPDIQFAVAALVVPSKVNLVCTVWLYLATLRKY